MPHVFSGPLAIDDCADGRHMAQMMLENPTWVAIDDTGDDGGHVAYCGPDTAPLFMAAPDMLAALKLCLDRDDIASDELGDAIRAVIAKATGGEG